MAAGVKKDGIGSIRGIRDKREAVLSGRKLKFNGFGKKNAWVIRPKHPSTTDPRIKARAWHAPNSVSAGEFERDLLYAGQQPARAIGLVEIPDLFEAKCLGVGRFSQHA